MMKSIKVIYTTSGCVDNDVIKGNYRKGKLYINISYLPEKICILIDGHISASDAEKCMQQLREKLCACEELIINQEVMRYHNHSPSCLIFGGLKNDLLDEGTEEKCFKKIHFYITYSLHDLN